MLEKIEEMLGAIEAHPDPAARETTRELVRELLDFHREGLARILELSEAGERLAGDPKIAPLLLLHGLHPDDLGVRVERALQKVRPYLASHGGSVELLGIEEGRVRLRLQGSCDGCPSSAETLKSSIEESILSAAPDVEGIEVV
ncbi:MAG: NifU family protein [Planctomycetes bacterium]|nr:NifU family protein [Planctomycetota bacterium]